MGVTAADIKDNPFLGRTGTVPRPSRETEPHQYPEHLARRQQWWDDAKERAAENDKIRADRLKTLDDERAARQAEADKAEEDRFVDGLRQKYLAADPAATEADFQKGLPEIRRQQRIRAAVEGDEAGA
jgi:hypothetical protein